MAKRKVQANDTTTKKTNPKKEVVSQNGTTNDFVPGLRLPVQKTYKLYIGGKFPRTESGRFYKLKNNGQLIANVCRGSRKDFRNAVVAARKAQGAWAGRTAYNRGQIIYRMAEMLEGRMEQFIAELQSMGATKAAAEKEVWLAVDRLVYYAGWADKYQQVFSSVNPVASSHFNFSVLEPMGVVAAFAPEKHGLLGLISVIIPAIVGGNTVVVLASETQPIPAISFAEALHTSDLPGGVINVLTGYRNELAGHFASHMDVNAMVFCGNDKTMLADITLKATDNLKRVRHYAEDWLSDDAQSPYMILDVQETKTTWHPVGIPIGGGGGY